LGHFPLSVFCFSAYLKGVNILFATAEAVPFCKTGGLGDVCGSLPRELAQWGHKPVILLPAFRQALRSGLPIESTGVRFTVPIGQKQVQGQFLQSRLPDSEVPVFLVEQADYFDRDQLYGEAGEDYKDNCERFTFFCQAVLRAVRLLDLRTDLIHCHDWCTGLIPAYLSTLEQEGRSQEEPLFEQRAYEQMASLFTIHNLAHQGNFWHWDMALTGIDWKYFNWRQLEFYGNLSFLKSGIVFADALSTVSPTYAQEILHPPLSCGLEGALMNRREDLFGIINGVDYQEWDPETDPFLGEEGYAGRPYGIQDFAEGKAACKAALQQQLGLPCRPEVPLLASVGRLADQKGFDLIARVIQGWTGSSNGEDRSGRPEVQWVILGTGEAKYHHVFSQLAAKYPQQVAVRLEFSNRLAHIIEAGADIFLMPSQYEPCGLNQLYSLKYGTVPLVRATGGLADTVVDLNEKSQDAGTATGFAFKEYSSLALADTIGRACQVYADKRLWHSLVARGMQQDWSWRESACQYATLYERTLEQAQRERLLLGKT
jgi:starch synthase